MSNATDRMNLLIAAARLGNALKKVERAIEFFGEGDEAHAALRNVAIAARTNAVVAASALSEVIDAKGDHR